MPLVHVKPLHGKLEEVKLDGGMRGLDERPQAPEHTRGQGKLVHLDVEDLNVTGGGALTTACEPVPLVQVVLQPMKLELPVWIEGAVETLHTSKLTKVVPNVQRLVVVVGILKVNEDHSVLFLLVDDVLDEQVIMAKHDRRAQA